jgi:hypothetical protein
MLANMLPGDLHYSLRCIGHSDPFATLVCSGNWQNKASKPIKCCTLPKVTIMFVRLLPLMSFNRSGSKVRHFTFKSFVSSRFYTKLSTIFGSDL